jgi:hypothetical protein
VHQLSKELERAVSENQGIELPGSPNDRLALALFREQAKPWENIALQHIELVTNTTKAFVEKLLDHLLKQDVKTRTALLRECVDPFFMGAHRKLTEKLQELLLQYSSEYSQPLDSEFRAQLAVRNSKGLLCQVDSLRKRHPRAFLQKSKERLKDEAIVNAFRKARAEVATDGVIDRMLTYYDVSLCTSGSPSQTGLAHRRQLSLRNFTENVMNLAVENCLISQIPSILTPEKIDDMDKAQLALLAHESEDIRLTREELRGELDALKEGLNVCRPYRGRIPTGEY